MKNGSINVAIFNKKSKEWLFFYEITDHSIYLDEQGFLDAGIYFKRVKNNKMKAHHNYQDI